MKIIILLSSLSILLIGCTSQKERKHKEEKLHKQQLEVEKKKIITDLVNRYNIRHKWDDLDFIYSINYKSVIESKYQLIEDFELTDIYEKDSIEYVSILLDAFRSKKFFFTTFLFDFVITKDQADKLLKNPDSLLLVVSVNEIRKLKLELKGEIDEQSAWVNLENSNDFIGKGKIIDIVSTFATKDTTALLVSPIPKLLIEKIESSKGNHHLPLILVGLFLFIFFIFGGILYSNKKKKLSKSKQAPEQSKTYQVSSDTTPIPPNDSRTQTEQTARAFHRQHADQTTGNLRQVYDVSDPENKAWFVTKEVDGGEGNHLFFVKDGQGGHEVFTRSQIAEPQETNNISEDDYASLALNDFDTAEQNRQLIESDQVLFNGKKYVLTGEVSENGYEALGEGDQFVTIPKSAVDKIKGGASKDIVTPTFGKIQVTGTKEGDAVVLSDPMTTDQVKALTEEVERTSDKTITADPITSDGENIYQVRIVPKIAPKQQPPIADNQMILNGVLYTRPADVKEIGVEGDEMWLKESGEPKLMLAEDIANWQKSKKSKL